MRLGRSAAACGVRATLNAGERYRRIMSTVALTKVALLIVVVALVPAVVWWMRRHPNRSKQHPDRQRMPKLVAVVGWMLLVVGVLMSLVAFTSSDADDPTAFRIASVAILFGGVLFLMMYRNWYVAPERDAVHYRTLMSREDRIVYSDIVDYRMAEANGQPKLRIRASSGAELALNPAMYDMSPLLAAIRFKEARGRWPLPGELPG